MLNARRQPVFLNGYLVSPQYVAAVSDCGDDFLIA
jgi:hypothetical protein